MNPEDFIDDGMSPVDIEKQQLIDKNTELSGALTSTGFQDQDNPALTAILETDKILERIEHFLKGDQVKFNESGAYFTEPTKNVLVIVKKDIKSGLTYYIQEIKEAKKGTELSKDVLVKIKNKDSEDIDIMENDSRRIMDKVKSLKLQNMGYQYVSILDENKKPLNEYGVSELMRIMSMYVTKETFLSFYDEERINEILADLGNALNNFLYCNYEKMGMDTKFKESKYTLIALNLLHTVESCYRRAIGGAEQKYMKRKEIITQNQGMGGYGGVPMNMSPRKKVNPFKPKTW